MFNVFDFIWNLASFIVALGILVTVHEYGHYWVAKKNNVKVERFSIGFGTPIWRKTDRHGTEFVIALIPLGGYVKMLDERVDSVAESLKPLAFNNKTVYQRIAIIAAGPLANFLFAIFAFYLMFLIGVPSVKPIVGDLAPASLAEKSGIPAGVEIKSVAGEQTLDWADVNLLLIANMGESEVPVSTKTSESVSERVYNLNLTEWKIDADEGSAVHSIGFVPYRPKVLTTVANVVKGSAAETAGIQTGDKLVAINGQQYTDDWVGFSNEIRAFPNKKVIITVLRNETLVHLSAVPKAAVVNDSEIGQLGVYPTMEPYPEEYRIEITYGIAGALFQALARTWELTTLSFEMIGKLVTGDVSVKNLSGPIAIAQGAGNSAEVGLVYFLGFLALISINLGIINILPLPVLDGGHLVYYLIELLTGKPVPEKVQELGFRFGAIALLGLMSIAIFNDLTRL